jgi:hypothetical protein
MTLWIPAILVAFGAGHMLGYWRGGRAAGRLGFFERRRLERELKRTYEKWVADGRPVAVLPPVPPSSQPAVRVVVDLQEQHLERRLVHADHPYTDPGDGRSQCEVCGKWVWLVLHSCKGVRVAPASPVRVVVDPQEQQLERDALDG